MNHHFPDDQYRNAINLSGTFIRRTNLNGVNLQGADLSQADCTNASFRGANFRDANLAGTILRGADLTDAVGLTREQLKSAILDKDTLLPSYLQ